MCVSAHIVDEPSSEEFDAAVRLLKLLADPTRLRIVWSLLHGEHAVDELAEHVGAKPAAVSQHLAKLRAADVVKVRRDGNRKFYRVSSRHIEQLTSEALRQADHLVAGGRHHRQEGQRSA